MNAEEYLSRSRLFQHLKNGAHGQLIERYTVRLIEDGLGRQSTWRCLNVVGGLLSWIASRRFKLTGLDERMAERYLRHRGRKQVIQRGDRAALNRFLSVLRDAGMIAPPVQPPTTPNEQIFKAFGDYLQRERGLTRRTIVTHLPAIRRFLSEVCPNGAGDLGKISQQDVIHYIERPCPGSKPEVRESDVLVAALISPIPPCSGAESGRVGRLRAIDQTVEAREPADLSVCWAGSDRS